ncbi:predicted protein [Uncinocarpus reesii 1704]|uniref:Uncharacterized protein n=1 Tax=Uncinocarpus reesii (strain UAMH 1704) TaxID=336963 RepID=C4JEV5_UNCRE|nr:uncharacterized protein UREG_00855 [Uncinocarpus reesii 1704]EEP76008.1 predicted protein [Uncinocarpus reesii 1704]
MSNAEFSEFFLAHGIDFERNPRSPLEVEFRRLAHKRGWTEKNGLFKKHWHECLVSELRFRFRDVLRCKTKHEALKALCDMIVDEQETEEITRYMHPINKTEFLKRMDTSSTKACIKILRRYGIINLIEWIDSQREQTYPVRFPSTRQYGKYTGHTKNFVPSSVIRQVPILKVLLR